MGEFGKQRVEKELEWKYEVPKLLEAYDVLFGEKGVMESVDNVR